MNTLQKKKRGRPKFEDDKYKGFMMQGSVSKLDSRRNQQNTFYYNEAMITTTEMKKAGEDMGFFFNTDRKKSPCVSVFTEVGRIPDIEIRKELIRILAVEMKKHPEVKYWREKVRAYRLKLKREGVF